MTGRDLFTRLREFDYNAPAGAPEIGSLRLRRARARAHVGLARPTTPYTTSAPDLGARPRITTRETPR